MARFSISDESPVRVKVRGEWITATAGAPFPGRLTISDESPVRLKIRGEWLKYE